MKPTANSADMFEIMGAFADFALCEDATCESCQLFKPIPERGTPEFETWRADVRAQVLSDFHFQRRPGAPAAIESAYGGGHGD